MLHHTVSKQHQCHLVSWKRCTEALNFFHYVNHKTTVGKEFKFCLEPDYLCKMKPLQFIQLLDRVGKFTVLTQFITTALSALDKTEITNSCGMIIRNCSRILTSIRYFMVRAGSQYFVDKTWGPDCGIKNPGFYYQFSLMNGFV